jgi:Sec-independent protein translocase protein TatA
MIGWQSRMCARGSMMIIASILSPVQLGLIVAVGLVLFHRRIPGVTHSLGYVLYQVRRAVTDGRAGSDGRSSATPERRTP